MSDRDARVVLDKHHTVTVLSAYIFVLAPSASAHTHTLCEAVQGSTLLHAYLLWFGSWVFRRLHPVEDPCGLTGRFT